VFLYETDEYPGESGTGTIIPEETMSLDEARAVLPFDFSLPTWAPEGFVLQEGVAVALPREMPYARLWWRNDDLHQSIYLEVMYPATDEQRPNWVVGPGSVEEVEVNGQPAALVHGAWNADAQEFGGDLLTLMWERDGVYYSLVGMEGQAEDLVRMAGSAP